MYGTRDAAASWENYYKKSFEKAGQKQEIFAGDYTNQTDGGTRWIQYEPDPRRMQMALGLDKC
eukprot:3415994-Amphidinium_carterae.1